MSLKEFDVPLSVIERRVRAPYAWMRLFLKAMVATADAVIVMIAGFAAAFLYHRVNFGVWWFEQVNMEFAVMAAALFVTLNAIRGQYDLSHYIGPGNDAGRAFWMWVTTFVVLFAISFGTKTTDNYSRIVVVSVFISGYPLMLMVRAGLARLMTLGSKIGVIPARRVMLVGREADIGSFARRYQPWNAGLEIVGTGIIDPRHAPEVLDEALERIAGQARGMFLDDVMIIIPWSETDTIDRVVEAFLRLPVAIQLGPERIFDRFEHVNIAKSGGIASLQLGRPPLSVGEVLAKRVFDVVLALAGIVVLLPLFVLIAIAVRLDSPGPVLFFQRRLGFNQRAFKIAKFRTMTVADDGDVVRQAVAGDSRITRVGHVLRRLSLDELPQLFNVLRGEMSLVGPRPHAIAHDREYDAKIALYARRHNVKPGITGWAQVHGLRGETDTEDKMRQRVEHDLFYIDHWSLLLDVEIIARTLFSAKTYENAR